MIGCSALEPDPISVVRADATAGAATEATIAALAARAVIFNFNVVPFGDLPAANRTLLIQLDGLM
jgi:hypothetical protein